MNEILAADSDRWPEESRNSGSVIKKINIIKKWGSIMEIVKRIALCL